MEEGPRGGEGRDGIGRALNFGGEPCDLLCPYSRFEFDGVDADRRRDQRRHRDEMDEAHHHQRFPCSIVASDGTPLLALPRMRGGAGTPAAVRAGASVRSAARNLADRARGFSWISAASGVTGRRVST